MTSAVDNSCMNIARPDTEVITELLKSGRVSDCRGVLENVLDRIHFREMNSLILRLYACMDIFITAKTFSKDIGISDEQFVERFGSVDELEPKLCSVDDMTEFLHETLTQCIKWRTDTVRSSGSGTMKAVMEYIDLNYMNCDISLCTVAEAVGLSPSYLSMLFKKETGLNFSDQLKAVRIHKAKELLSCTSKMVYEVAYDVGFRDYRYFGQIFKKCTGMTPREFQYVVNVCA